MANIGLSFLIGRNRSNLFGKANVSALDNPATQVVKKRILEEILERSSAVTTERVYEVFKSGKYIKKVEDNLYKDIEIYVRSAVQFFTSRESPLSSGITLRVPNVGAKTRNSSGFTQKSTPGESIFWPALSRGTIQRKGHNKFFKDSDKLATQLRSLLPGFFHEIINPRIEVEVLKNVVNPRNKEKITVANVQVKIATANTKGLSKVPFFSGKVTKNNGVQLQLLTDYLFRQLDNMGEDILTKLANTDIHNKRPKDRKQRPWVEQSMSFWVLHRLPAVFDKTMRAATERAVKNLGRDV